MKEPKSFDPAYAKSVSKDVFVKQHEHLKGQFDLAAIWDHYNPKPEKTSNNTEK
jgi:hypothetical protein